MRTQIQADWPGAVAMLSWKAPGQGPGGFKQCDHPDLSPLHGGRLIGLAEPGSNNPVSYFLPEFLWETYSPLAREHH